jgi:large subunit ribosomal protein L17
MRHKIKGRKLSRASSHRNSLLKNLAKSLLQHEQITTTLPKAKELRPYVEKLITQGKKGDLSARKKIISILNDKNLAEKLISTLGERYKSRYGGYTRIYKAGFRSGDNASMGVIELVDRNVEAKGKTI